MRCNPPQTTKAPRPKLDTAPLRLLEREREERESAMSNRSLESLSPIETLELDSGLSLVPRIKLLLTIHRSENSVKPIDDWQLKRSLIDFCKSSFSVTVPEEDLKIRRFKDVKKRKREDPVARGTLVIRDLGFLSISKFDDGEGYKVKVLEKKYADWRKNAVDKMDGIELSIVGVKFKLSVEVPGSDDFDGMKKEWEELIAFGGRGLAFCTLLCIQTFMICMCLCVYEFKLLI